MPKRLCLERFVRHHLLCTVASPQMLHQKLWYIALLKVTSVILHMASSHKWVQISSYHYSCAWQWFTQISVFLTAAVPNSFNLMEIQTDQFRGSAGMGCSPYLKLRWGWGQLRAPPSWLDSVLSLVRLLKPACSRQGCGINVHSQRRVSKETTTTPH